MSRFRRVCFTINNPTEEDTLAVMDTDSWQCLIWKLEIGKSGTPHIQGYGELLQQQYKEKLRKILGGRAHIEPSKGTYEQNLKYCSKDGSLDFEFGTPRKQGSRTDIKTAREIVTTGGMRAVVEQVDSYQAWRAAEMYLKYTDPPRTEKPYVIWLYGETGAGKSRVAQLIAPDAYWKDGTKWWDGYDRHQAVIIDDFRSTHWTLDYMLRLLDRYPCRVEVKGGSRQFVADVIIITSPYPPTLTYSATAEDIGQLIRRIDEINEVSTPPPQCIHDSKVGGNTKPPPLSDRDVFDDIFDLLY